MKPAQQDNQQDCCFRTAHQQTLRWCKGKVHYGLIMTAEIWDVIIVGAGLSGLSAAHLLKKRNAKLKVLIAEGKGLWTCVIKSTR